MWEIVFSFITMLPVTHATFVVTEITLCVICIKKATYLLAVYQNKS